MHDEPSALAEAGLLNANAQMHLAHTIRTHVMRVKHAVECGTIKELYMDILKDFEVEAKRMGV